MRRTPQFTFWKMWHDGQRRLWAEPYHNTDMALAKQYHREACEFGWRLSGQHERMVTDLTGDDGAVRTTIAPGVREDEVDVTPRTFHERIAD
jgi:hypothetical protein